MTLFFWTHGTIHGWLFKYIYIYKVICVCSASMYSKTTILQANIGQEPMNRCSCFPKDFYENLISFSALHCLPLQILF